MRTDKKFSTKTIIQRSLAFILLLVSLLVSCQSTSGGVTKGSLQHFLTSTNRPCILCGNVPDTLLSAYRGQQNLGIINLNTSELIPITINRYDSSGRLVEEPTAGISTQITNMAKSDVCLSIAEDVDRGFARGHLSINSDKILDIKRASSHLCPGCLDHIIDDCWSDTPMGIGVIDLYSGEVRLLEQNISAFMIGDYYVSCSRYDDPKNDEWCIDLLVFYCPKRY